MVVIGAGVVGCSVAWHLARLSAGRVLVLERGRIGEGTSAQSSGILRSHYSVLENMELARRSWQVFTRFADYLKDDDASAGLVRCGYLITAPEGPQLEPLQATLAAQQAQGITVHHLSRAEAMENLPIAHFNDSALIGYEPEASFADPYLTATSFARTARCCGVQVLEGRAVRRLLLNAQGQVRGVATAQGDVHAPVVVSTQNIWAGELAAWTGIPVPLVAERHRVLALDGPAPYTHAMPVFKDLGSPGMLYGRS